METNEISSLINLGRVAKLAITRAQEHIAAGDAGMATQALDAARGLLVEQIGIMTAARDDDGISIPSFPGSHFVVPGHCERLTGAAA